MRVRELVERVVNAVARLDPRVAWLVLAGSMLVAVVLVLAWSGDRTFVIDEWSYLLQRSHWDAEVLLRPTLGHLTAGGLVLYNLMFSAFGAEYHLPLTLSRSCSSASSPASSTPTQPDASAPGSR